MLNTHPRPELSPADLNDLDYTLPSDRIAQRPLARRDSSRLLVLDRAEDRVLHSRFSQIGRFLRAGDLLVLNDTRVIPARIEGRKRTGGRVELTLLNDESGMSSDESPERWALVRTFSGRLREGTEVLLEEGVRVVLHEIHETGMARVELQPGGPLAYAMRHGHMPLPPYIRRRTADPLAAMDRKRYQTVYAETTGAVAAPTAGLHFTQGLLSRLEAAGVGVAKITLHVGYGTFAPVRSARLEEHRMHREFYRIGKTAAQAIRRAHSHGGRIVAVGTTSARALEAASARRGILEAGEGWTEIFIRPGFRLRCVDAIITNFHMPRTTPIAMVGAFAGIDRVREVYREAIEKGYRFLSYGDAMLIV